MYEMGCFTTNGFYPTTSSCSSNTSSPDSTKHQRLLVTATPSPPNVSHQYFPQQYLFDHPRFHFDNNSNSNGSSEIHSSSSSTTSSHDQLNSWFLAQASAQQSQSTFAQMFDIIKTFVIDAKKFFSFSLHMIHHHYHIVLVYSLKSKAREVERRDYD